MTLYHADHAEDHDQRAEEREGVRSTETKSGTNRMFSTNSITFPIYIEAMRPQTNFWILREQERTRLDVEERESAHHHRRGRRARNAQGEHRDHVAAGRGIVGRAGAGHRFDGTLAEALGMLGQLLLDRVGEQRRDRATGARAAGRRQSRLWCRGRWRERTLKNTPYASGVIFRLFGKPPSSPRRVTFNAGSGTAGTVDYRHERSNISAPGTETDGREDAIAAVARAGAGLFNGIAAGGKCNCL